MLEFVAESVLIPQMPMIVKFSKLKVCLWNSYLMGNWKELYINLYRAIDNTVNPYRKDIVHLMVLYPTFPLSTACMSQSLCWPCLPMAWYKIGVQHSLAVCLEYWGVHWSIGIGIMYTVRMQVNGIFHGIPTKVLHIHCGLILWLSLCWIALHQKIFNW